MGILNVTPDSFSDGGEYFSESRAIEHGLRLAEEGADILDIGGESTRPGSDLISINEEIRRVVPVIEKLASQVSIPISIDTSKAGVAREALNAGACIVNDISGLRFDSKMIDVCCEFPCGIVAMHIQGTPQTMQLNPQYLDVVQEVTDYFQERLETLQRAGIDQNRVVLDPGIGFGKTANHNLQLLSSINRLHSLNRPILIGHSRKRFLKKLIGREVDERLMGTLGVSLALASQRVDIIRVHDVAAHRDALIAFQTILDQIGTE